jgi:GNAT superfamily N-acetyltransferase
MVTIKKWTETLPRGRYADALAEIFFLNSAKREFANSREKAAYLKKWTDLYLQVYPESLFLALEEDVLAGYLTGCPDTFAYLSKQSELPYLHLFQDCYADYPAHFHINCHPKFQGHGIGSALIRKYLEGLTAAGVPGVHIITGATASNVSFYQKCGFARIKTATWGAAELLLMGKNVPHAVGPNSELGG